ncbi:MAG: hypothetical protein JWM74_91 [Myxococcaceae bacterium]|nr:hypothetical protein [Myxococcaceae bacterium]
MRLSSRIDANEREPSLVTTNANQAEIGLCLFLAGADGDASKEEIAELKKKMKEMLEAGTSDGVLDALIDGEQGAIEDAGRAGYLAKLKDRIAADRREPAFRMAVDVAFADELNVDEDKCVREVAKALGIDAKLVDEIAGPAIG